jgi:hypothetical protein
MKNYQPRTVDILSFIYTVGYFITLGIAFFVPFPTDNKDTLVLLLGILSTIMAKIVEAYFSKDSANSATATAIRAMTTPPPPEIPADQPKGTT